MDKHLSDSAKTEISNKVWIFLGHIMFLIGIVSPTTRAKISLNASPYVQVECETGEITFELVSVIAADDPVTCAAYAKEHDLLAAEGWPRFMSRTIKSLQGQSSQVRSDKSGDPKPTCLGS